MLRLTVLVNQPLGKIGTVCIAEGALLTVGHSRSKDEFVLIDDFIRLPGIDDSLLRLPSMVWKVLPEVKTFPE